MSTRKISTRSLRNTCKTDAWSSGCEFNSGAVFGRTESYRPITWLSALPTPHIPQKLFIDGPAGKLETVLAEPDLSAPAYCRPCTPILLWRTMDTMWCTRSSNFFLNWIYLSIQLSRVEQAVRRNSCKTMVRRNGSCCGVETL